MKTNKIYILGLLIALLGTISCKNEVEDVFDDSAANRITKTMAENKAVFCGAKNGWEMQYFANDGEMGYIFLMKFNEDGSVKVAAKNKYSNENTYSEYTSVYQMIADNGPVITFNSYNPLFHAFSNPDDIDDTKTDETGRGHEGDYEFVVMSAKADEVILRGKKRKLTIIMRPLSENQGWEDYFTKLEAMDSRLFSSKIPTLYFKSQNTTYAVSGMSDHKISYYPVDGDPVTQTENAVFSLTADGVVRFCNPIDSLEVDGKKTYIQEFKISEDDALTSIEGQKATIEAADPANLFMDKSFKWRIDPDQMGGKLATAYNDVVKAVKDKYKMVFQYFQFTYSKDTYMLSFKSGSSSGNYYGTETIDNGAVKCYYDGTGDNNGNNFLKNVPAFKAFLDAVNSSSYTISCTSKIKPTVLKMTSTANAEDYFYVNVQ